MKIIAAHTVCLLILINSALTSRMLSESPAPENTCNPHILSTYGLEGNFSPEHQDNPNCPNVHKNCCSRLDSNATQDHWQRDASKKISAYYETYLFSLKYILGFVEQANELAEDMLESHRSVCKKAAERFKHMGLNRKNTSQIFQVMTKGLKTVAELRRGFYCAICDGDVHRRLDEAWQQGGDAERVMQVSEGFCENLVEKTIASAFFETFYIKEISEVMSVLVSCGKNIQHIEKLEYQLPVEGVEQVKNCFHFGKKYFFYHCSSYCERFNFARASGFFDGNLEQLRKFVEFLHEHRKGGFYNPSSNFLMDVDSWEENYLEKNFEEFGRHLNNNELFYVPEEEHLAFDRMSTEVVLDGGIDLFPSTADSAYRLILNRTTRWAWGVSLILAWLFK